MHLFYKFRPERTGFDMYAEYTQVQLTFLALQPLVQTYVCTDSISRLYFTFIHLGEPEPDRIKCLPILKFGSGFDGPSAEATVLVLGQACEITIIICKICENLQT